MPKIPPEDRADRAERLIEIGKRIRAARISKGFQQNEFAEKIGVQGGTVSGWEAGTHGIGQANLKRVVEVTGEPSSYFLSERLAKKHTITRSARDLGTALGLHRIEALLSLPGRRLLKEIDAIIGARVVQIRSRPPRSQ